MTKDMPAPPPASKEPDARYPYGPRPVGVLVPKLTRAAFRKHSPAGAQLMADWPEIVGPALAATAHPRRFAAGTLTLGCTGPVALELQHLAGPLIERINLHLGRSAVVRLRFVQEAPSPVLAPPPLRPRAPPVAVHGIGDDALRDALGALGAALQTARGDPA